MSGFTKKVIYSEPVSGLISYLLAHASKWVPVKHVRETNSWLAFMHPNPTYPIHLVIVPKRQIENWMQLPLNDPALYAEFVEITQDLIKDFFLETTGYRIITNGGNYQDFPHLHIHLVAGEAY